MPTKPQAPPPTTAVATRPEEPIEAKFDRFVSDTATRIVAAMPISVPTEGLTRARALMRVAFSADAHGALWECTPESVARAMVLSAISGCMPGGPRPDVWLIPRKNRHRGNQLEVNWQMSARGYIRLARRALWDVEPVAVFADDDFEHHEGMTPHVVHRPRHLAEPSWDTLEYVYARIFPLGRRVPEATKVAVLTKAEIARRRAKAQDDSVWKEWPVEMALKTILSYAGAREMYPTDDAARFAMHADLESEVGGSAAAAISAPPASRTEALAERLGGRSLGDGGQTIDLPQQGERETVPAANGGEAPGERTLFAPQEAVPLTAADVDRMKAFAGKMNVDWLAVEEEWGGPLEGRTVNGKPVRAIDVEASIRELAGR